MKFTCKTNNLKEAISKVERIVSKQTTLPILGNILFSTESGRLLIASTNLEIAVKVYIGAKIEKEGQITIPSRILGGFLQTISDDVISGELMDLELKMTSEKHKIKIKGIDAKDFPIIPDCEKEVLFSIKGGFLSKAIAGVLVSVARNDTRQELNGVLMKFKEKKIILASTDSFRLTEVSIPLNESVINKEYNIYREKNPSIIIPSTALIELQRVVFGDDGVDFVVDQNQLFISSDNVKIISRLINGNYPEYQQVVPKKFDIEIVIDKKEFIDAIKIAALVGGNQNGEVRLKNSQSGKNLIISAQSIDTGDNLSKIPAEIKCGDFDVLFNCRYLLEGLGSVLFNSPQVSMNLNQQKSPVMLRNSSEDSKSKFSYVVMPIIKG